MSHVVLKWFCHVLSFVCYYSIYVLLFYIICVIILYMRVKISPRLSFFCKEDHGSLGAKILFSYWITIHSVISLSSGKTVSTSLWDRRAALCGQLAALCCHSIALCCQLIPLCCLHPLPYAEKSRRRCWRMETAKTSARDWLFVIFLTKWGLLLCGGQPGTGIALREGVRTKFQGTYSG